MGHSQSSSKREIYSNTGLPQETTTTKKSNEQSNLHLKELEKEEQTKPKLSRRKERKIRTEINETEMKKE